jgi:KDO2-lipid IV(A) lauroyltransferase
MPPAMSSETQRARLPLWFTLLSRLPLAVLYAFTACLAFVVHRIVRYRVAVVRANIAGSFPELTAKEQRALERAYYSGLGELVAEVVKSGTLSRADIAARVALRNLEAVRSELEAGRSVLIVAAHQCNWEWLLLALSCELGYPVEAAYKPLRGARSEQLMRALRTRFGGSVVPAKELLGSILKRRGARVIAMVADQEPVTSEYKWWTVFLNRPTAFYMGPEKIAQVTRFAVVFAAMRRSARGHYEVSFEPVQAARQPAQPGFVTERYARLVEAQVRASPRDWTWSHRRWKLRRPVYAGATAPNALDQGLTP